VSLQHFQNPNEAINQEIFVCIRNRVWQRPNLFFKPCDDITHGANLLRIWQASCANLIQCPLQSRVELTKPFTVAEAVVPEFFPLHRNSSPAISQDMNLFILQHIDSSAQPRTLSLQFLPICRQ
jgi:hypothetical protein